MSSLRVQIDGKWVNANADETILDVAKRLNIEIPHLCHDDQLEPYGSCFVCVVKVEGARTLQPSCATKVRDGMVITTKNEEIEKSRKMALELLLSNHFADCQGTCVQNCPTGVDVQGYIALAAMGKYKDAIKLIKETNPLPTVCGRVCTRPCELNCRRGILDESVAIDDIKRYAADYDLFSEDRYFPEIKTSRPEKVAIVGAGPAGLSAAYYLAVEGYKVDIFEAHAKAGGMLRYGIPQYRLPEDILDKEVEGITGLGVNINYNTRLGKDFTIDSLFSDGYKSVFLALGAQKSTHITIEGENLENVMAGIEFLEQVELGDMKALHGRVAVVGGGNTAIDAARTALRMGASEVKIVYRRTIKEMPANPEEIEAAQHEGIDIMFLNNPKRYIGKNGKVSGIECIKMELGEPDASGRRRPVPVEGSEFVMDVDYVIEAIGQKPDLSGLPVDGENGPVIKLTRWNTLDVDPVTMETNIPGVFAAGDVVLGPATAVEAIGGGKNAANAIHHYITGEWIRDIKPQFVSKRDNFRPLTAKDYLKFEKSERHSRPELEVSKRIHTFEEVELTFPEEDVLSEAARCLECGCKVFYDCKLQQAATEYQADQKAFIGEFQEYDKDTRHPFIEFDMNKCILCGKCVRICDEVVGLNALGFVNRGFVAKIAPSLEKPLQETSCISCGLCVDVCPTGAISDTYSTPKPGPWQEQKVTTVCDFCGIGCEMDANIKADTVVHITSPDDGKVNPFGNLCFTGRYGYRYAIGGEKISTPYIRKNGKLIPATWDEAVEKIAEAVKGDNAAVAVSPKLTLEEQFQIQKFSRTVLRSDNLGSFNDFYNFTAANYPLFTSSGTLKEIPVADAVMVVGDNLQRNFPVALFEVNKFAFYGGKVLVAGSNGDEHLARKNEFIDTGNKQEEFFKLLTLAALEAGTVNGKLKDEYISKVKSRCQEAESSFPAETVAAVNKLFAEKSKLFILWQPEQLEGEVLQAALHFKTVAEGTSVKFLTLMSAANVAGTVVSGAMAGLLPDNSADREKLSALWRSELPELNGVTPNKMKGADSWWIFGEDPIGTTDDASVGDMIKKAGFKLVADVIWTETAKEADVVLPLADFAEKDGLLINFEGRLQQMRKTVSSGAMNDFLKLFAEVARKKGYNFMAENSVEVRGDLVGAVNKLEGSMIKNAVSDEIFLTDFAALPPVTPPEDCSIERKFSHNANGLNVWLGKYAEVNEIKL